MGSNLHPEAFVKAMPSFIALLSMSLLAPNSCFCQIQFMDHLTTHVYFPVLCYLKSKEDSDHSRNVCHKVSFTQSCHIDTTFQL